MISVTLRVLRKTKN